MSEKPLLLSCSTFDPPKSPLKRGTLRRFSPRFKKGDFEKIFPVLKGEL
jgi:hypothetical protein